MHAKSTRMQMEIDMVSGESDQFSDYSNTRVERIGTTRNKTKIKGGKSSRSGDTESMGQFSMADIDDDDNASSGSDTEVQKETPSGKGKAQQKSKFDFGAIPEEKWKVKIKA